MTSVNVLEKMEEMRKQEVQFRNKKRELENKIKDLAMQVRY